MRFELTDFVFIYELQLRNIVFQSTLVQVLQKGDLTGIRGYDEFSDFLERQVVLAEIIVGQLHTLDAKFRLSRNEMKLNVHLLVFLSKKKNVYEYFNTARFIVNSSVHDATVVPRLMHGQLFFLFHYANL